MMPLHQRNVGKTEKDQSNTPPQTRNVEEKSKSPKKNFASIVGLGATQLLFLGYVALKSKSKSKSRLIYTLLTAQIVSLPAFLSVALGLGLLSKPDLPHQKYIPLAVAATILGNQLPTFLSSLMANVAVVIFGLASRPVPEKKEESKKDEVEGTTRLLSTTILMTTILLMENFCVWVVSATYEQGQNKDDLPKPLQDNGQIVLRYFFNSVLGLKKRDVVTIRNMINVEWILVACLALSIVALEMDGFRMKRSLLSICPRVLLTLAMSRLIRAISFMITVLPNQNPRCYFGHFPYPPPADWTSWIMEGLKPNANGGCNDLIISGHATVTASLACMVTSVVGKPEFTTAIWLLLAMDYMVEVFEGFHYSVDMWLGALLANFIWTVLAPVEESAYKQGRAKSFYPLADATLSDFWKYFLPALVSYLQLNGFLLPFAYANYTIVSYFVIVGYQVNKYGFQQYTQHLLICVMFLTFGVYL